MENTNSVALIRLRLTGGLITSEQALTQLAPFMRISGRKAHPEHKAAKALVDEILGMPEEPEAMPKSVLDAITDADVKSVMDLITDADGNFN
jgi:hypothetical protein